MKRTIALFLAGLLALSACTAPDLETTGPGELPPPKVYRIRKADTSKIQFRMLDSVNSLRQASGAQPVQLNSQLIAAAQTHARDMANQSRPWNWGSDLSSTIDRAARAGYPNYNLGEVISETYESEIETLGAWMEDPGSRAILLDGSFSDMGFAWYQEGNGKIWWTLVMGG